MGGNFRERRNFNLRRKNRATNNQQKKPAQDNSNKDKQALDMDLDKYMSKTKSSLDTDLDTYMAQAAQNNANNF